MTIMMTFNEERYIKMDNILTIKDVQKNLGIGKNRAYELGKLKGFPKIKIGHRYYIPEAAYNEWIKNNTKSRIIL